MAHLIEQMAYVGDTPWHGLGNQLDRQQSLDVWAQQAGMDWQILESPVCFMTEKAGHLGAIQSFPEQKVLYRSDNRNALSVVSSRYHVVQPRAILEFYRDLTDIAGFELETAGVLKGGRKFWALAKTGQTAVLKGNDRIGGYLLLATSCDGTLATTATPTTVRVVCNNTLSIAVNGTTQAIKVPHNTRFDADKVKQQLGLAVSHWDTFLYQLRTLSETKVKTPDAMDYFLRALYDLPSSTPEDLISPHQKQTLTQVSRLYAGQGRGAELASSKNSAWGLLNAVTEFVDHEKRARSQDNRLDSAWFGQGAAIKQRALEVALQMAT